MLLTRITALLEMWPVGIAEALLGPLCCGNERESPFRKACVQLTVKDSPRPKGSYKELARELLFNSLSKMFCRFKNHEYKVLDKFKAEKNQPQIYQLLTRYFVDGKVDWMHFIVLQTAWH